MSPNFWILIRQIQTNSDKWTRLPSFCPCTWNKDFHHFFHQNETSVSFSFAFIVSFLMFHSLISMCKIKHFNQNNLNLKYKLYYIDCLGWAIMRKFLISPFRAFYCWIFNLRWLSWIHQPYDHFGVLNRIWKLENIVNRKIYFYSIYKL